MPAENKGMMDQPKFPPTSSADPCPEPLTQPHDPCAGSDWIEGEEGAGAAYLSNPERWRQGKSLRSSRFSLFSLIARG
jgi:hypothetical protein